VELQPHLVGALLELRPLRLEDWDELFAVASDPAIWEQHPLRERYKEALFRDFFNGGLKSGGAFVAIDRKTGKIIGSSRYADYDPEKREVEIGWTFLATSYWGGVYNAEMKRMMLDHAFQFVDTVVLNVGVSNLRSQKAVEKIGGVVRGRKDVDFRGATLEHLVYEIKRVR
jgi:RimJ/RimL family protein N-acetyltransferase